MNGNLLSTHWPRAQQGLAAKAMLIGLGIVLLTLSAKIQVPFWPVPMTLQALVVLLIGATSGARLGAATLAAYLALGAAGLPVFASGAGPAYMVGPTGGYLAGFLAAATLTGWLADKGMGRTVSSALVLFLAGEVVIFALGCGWLSLLIGPAKAIAGGLLPFIPAEILKVALGTAIMTAAWRSARR